MLAQRKRFAHLRRIDVSKSYLGDDVLAQLRGLGPEITADDMNDANDYEDRFVSVGE